MRTSQSFLLFSTVLLYLSASTSAWPWPSFLPALDSLVGRADPANSTTPASKSAGSSVVEGTGATNTTGSATSTTATKEKSSSTKKTSTTSHITVPINAPAGGLDMLVPDTTSGSIFYKISDFVTFAWNYTSLDVTPTAIDILVTCTSNAQMYTIARNMSVGANATGAVTWDTNDYPEKTSAPLLTAIYTMYIFDSDTSITAAASPGFLSVFDYSFGMYTKQPYVSLPAFTCATCNGALSDTERRALGFMFGMASITVLSFTWFVTGMRVVW